MSAPGIIVLGNIFIACFAPDERQAVGVGVVRKLLQEDLELVLLIARYKNMGKECSAASMICDERSHDAQLLKERIVLPHAAVEPLGDLSGE